MASVIDRAATALTRLGGVPFTSSDVELSVPSMTDDGFEVSLNVAGPRRFLVRYDNWHQVFDRAEDAYDCFEYGLSDSCRLRVTYRGTTPVECCIERRQYGLWVPGRAIARRLSPFWRSRRIVHRQNRVFTAPGP